METATFPVEETWRLSDLFEDDEAFHASRRSLSDELESLALWRGRLDESAQVLAEALDSITGIYRRFARLRCYSALRSDADTRIGEFQAMRQEVELLATELSDAISYLRPEILAMDPEVVERYLGGEPRLEPHGFFLRDLMRQRPHVLGAAEEKIMAQSGLVTRSPSSLFQILQNVELPRPEVTLSSGQTVSLSPVEFHRHRASQTRADRMKVFPAFFGAYGGFKDTLGHNLYAAVKSHMFRARVRNHPSCLHAALDADNVPVSVYHNLVRQVRQNLPLLHRYFRLRARTLGVERLDYPDLYCPLSEAPPTRYSTVQARELVQDSVRPIGDEYSGALDRAFDERWIDWHPGPGKRAGAYATGWAYDVHPYVLLNYTGEYESVSTLAHEMGHAMHSYFSNRTQPYARADYSIFVAEVASTLNEALLSRKLIDAAGDEDERLYLLATYIDGIRGTLFRQTMFAEFELKIHEMAESGEVLTGERLNEVYLELLRDYHGHDQGVVHIAEEYAVEWAAIPHFYFDFYVYQYATGIVAASALAARLLEGADGAVERYLGFLSAGGSDYPLNLLRDAGVDLESAEPYTAAFAGTQQRLDLLEALLDGRAS